MTDDIQYQVCRKYPDHSRKSSIGAKLWIIGRTYATEIERQIKSSGEQGDASSKLEEHLYNKRKEIDSILKRLSPISEPLLDRIDIHCEVPAVRFGEMRGDSDDEPSEAVKPA